MLINMIRANNKYQKGVIDVPDEEAEELISAGAAVKVVPEKGGGNEKNTSGTR